MKFLTLLLLCTFSVMANAQIGYQVTLLNFATGEPRANETVNVTVTMAQVEMSVHLLKFGIRSVKFLGV